MKCVGTILFILALTASAAKVAEDADASPVAKVIKLLDGMTGKVKAEESDAASTLKESNEFCEKRTTELGYSIKTGKSNVEKFESRIEKASMKIDGFADSIEESLSKSEADQSDLSAAVGVRAKEKKDFDAEVKELKDTMSTLEKASLVLQKGAMSKSESLLQVQQAPNVLKAVEAMVSASMISAQDGAGLSSLLQKAEAEDEQFQAPVGPAYEKKAGGILDLIEDLYDKTKEQLTALQDKEKQAVHNYDMLAKSLQDAIDFSKKEVLKAKGSQREEQKLEAEAKRNLKQTTENLNKDEAELVDLGRDCKRKNEDYAIEKKDRDAELKAVATAKEALTEKAMGASNQQYGSEEPASFLQIGRKSMIRTASDLANVEVVHMIRDLAHKQHSKELALLAQKIGAVMRTSQHSKTPEVLKKIVSMIRDMIASMENRLNEDTTKKAYCDSERAKVKDKKADKQDLVDEYQAKMDGIASQSAQFKADVQQLQKALAELAGAKKEMMQIREQEKAAFDKNAPEMAAGLEGVKTALKVLREYYESTGKRGGANGIIGMLEVCESDFSKSLSDMKTAETTAAEDYEKELKEMKIEKTRKEADVKYKTEAADTLDRDLINVKADADAVGEEMAAIIEYSNGIEGECAETKESFAEKAAKRQAEIDGLKTALHTLKVENEPAGAEEGDDWDGSFSMKVKVRYSEGESLAQGKFLRGKH